MTDDDYLPPGSTSVSLSPGVAWGLVAVIVGCTLLISACVLMVFNITLFSHGLAGVLTVPARVGAALGLGGVAVLGLFAIAFGVKGWNAALARGESTALGVAGTLAGVVGFFAWVAAGTDLLLILFG